MKKFSLWFCSAVLLSAMFFSCKGKNDPNNPLGGGTTSDASEEEIVTDDEEDFVENSNWNTTVSLAFSGSSVQISNPLDGQGVSVTQESNMVIVRSTVKHVEYALSGTGTMGVRIFSDYKIKISLNGVALTCSSAPALNVQTHKHVYCVVTGTNSLTDAKGYADESIIGSDTVQAKGAFFSEGQVIISGDGSLTVTGNNKHAFSSDDYIRVRSGALTCQANVTDGIHTNDGFILDGGTVNITSVDDGIQVDNDYILISGGSISITTSGQKAKGMKAQGDIRLNGGSVYVKTSKSEAEGIESKSMITINGGEIVVEAYDDCINAGTGMVINGGKVYCYSTNNDGLDSNGNLTINDGLIFAIGTKQPEVGLDYNTEKNATFTINGGTFIGVGGSSDGFTSSSIYCLSFSGKANTTMCVSNSSNTNAMIVKLPSLSYTPQILCGSPNFISGTNTILTGGTASGDNWHGLYINGSYSGGSQYTTATGSTSGGNGGGTGGGPGGGGDPGGGGGPGGGGWW